MIEDLIKKKMEVFEYIDSNLQTDKLFVQKLILHTAYFFKLLNEELRSTFEILIIAVFKDPNNF